MRRRIPTLGATTAPPSHPFRRTRWRRIPTLAAVIGAVVWAAPRRRTSPRPPSKHPPGRHGLLLHSPPILLLAAWCPSRADRAHCLPKTRCRSSCAYRPPMRAVSVHRSRANDPSPRGGKPSSRERRSPTARQTISHTGSEAWMPNPKVRTGRESPPALVCPRRVRGCGHSSRALGRLRHAPALAKQRPGGRAVVG